MIPPISLRMWGYIGTAAVIALLVIALLVTRETLDNCKRERRTAENSLSVSNASIDTLTSEIKRMRDEQLALSAADTGRIAASRQTLEIARAAEKWREAAIDRLNASAESMDTTAAVETCEASAAVQAVWQ